MPEFLAEAYTPRGTPGTAAPRAGDIAVAAGQASGHGVPVRFLGAIAVPDEETCFWLFQAPAAGAVRAVMTRAGLRPERITPAVLIRPPHDGPAAFTATSDTCTGTSLEPGSSCTVTVRFALASAATAIATLAAASGNPTSIAADTLTGTGATGQLYWTTEVTNPGGGSGAVSQAELDGTSPHAIVTGQDFPDFVAVSP